MEMFQPILGYGSRRSSDSDFQEGSERTWGMAARWRAAGPGRVAGLGAPAVGERSERTSDCRRDSADRTGNTEGGTSLGRGWPCPGSVRKAATRSGRTARRQPETADYRHGVQRSTARVCPLDRSSGGAGGGQAETGAKGRKRNNPHTASAPRPQAVAGKKCGASPNLMKITYRRWRTSSKPTNVPTILPNRSCV